MSGAEARILIASDAASDAEVVQRMLKPEYPRVATSTHAQSFIEDFERCRPQVLVLAFKALQEAERYYLGLYRGSPLVNALAHRTLLLCDKADLANAYALCRKGNFDDYVLFWPLVHDATRLPMSVHLALRALDSRQTTDALAQMTAQARRIADLEALLDSQLATGQAHAEQANRSMRDAQTQVDVALSDFSRRMLDTGLDNAVKVNDAAQVRHEIDCLNESVVQPPLRQAAQALQPVQQWLGEIKTGLAAPLQAARSLAEQSSQTRPLVLVVDDDDLLRKILVSVLRAARYDVEGTPGATEAMAVLRRRRPDLILMDVQMPDVDGIELTRRLKASETYAAIPVIMLTGQGDKGVLVDSLAAGAADFVVKPFDREVLLKKVARYAGG